MEILVLSFIFSFILELIWSVGLVSGGQQSESVTRDTTLHTGRTNAHCHQL